MSAAPRDHAAERYGYLTTTGRVSGLPREIEIWFAVPPGGGRTLYLMAGSGARANWVRNLRRDPAVTMRLGDDTYRGRARVVAPDTPEDAVVRRLLCGKYEGWREGQPLSEWGRMSLPVAIELDAGE